MWHIEWNVSQPSMLTRRVLYPVGLDIVDGAWESQGEGLPLAVNVEALDAAYECTRLVRASSSRPIRRTSSRRLFDNYKSESYPGPIPIK